MLNKVKIWIVLMLMCPLITGAQVIDIGGLYEVKTKDHPAVYVVPGYDKNSAHVYYYLPTNLRLSSRPDNTCEFNFMTYAGDGAGSEGAILHMLLVWGLEPKQEKEVEMLLREQHDSLAVLGGCVSVQVPEAGTGVKIIGKTPLADLLRTKWSKEPVAPVFPGTKMALSYKLQGAEVQLFQDALDHPEKLDSIVMELKFQFEGGYKELWFSKFHDNFYSLRVPFHQILQPVIGKEQKKKK